MEENAELRAKLHPKRAKAYRKWRRVFGEGQDRQADRNLLIGPDKRTCTQVEASPSDRAVNQLGRCKEAGNETKGWDAWGEYPNRHQKGLTSSSRSCVRWSIQRREIFALQKD